MLFLTIVRLFIFASLVPIAQFVEASGFFQGAVTLLETKKPRSLIPVETCFFGNVDFSIILDYSLSAYFCRLSSAERTF